MCAVLNIMKHLLLLCLIPMIFSSCSRYDAVSIVRAAATGNPAAAAEALARDKAWGYAANPQALEGDIKQFSALVEDFIQTISQVWGDDNILVPKPKKYVKYTENYLSRASVDFDNGIITIETVDTDSPKTTLANAIVTTLLTPADPRSVDLYSAQPVAIGDTPFLMGEVKDHENKDIRWEWRAQRFANHLVDTQLKSRKTDKTVEHYVTIPMVRDHLDVRARKYADHVVEMSNRFNISRNLIYAIMKVESDFNPFAVSSAKAIGLMQVVPSTAGSDTYEYLNNRKGTPSTKKLFVPRTNILYGTTYLHLLETRYLSAVSDPLSREYCIIAAYNGGAGTVLRTFDSNRQKAANKINQLPPGEVYKILRTKVPYKETRRYLGKVLEAKKHFVNF